MTPDSHVPARLRRILACGLFAMCAVPAVAMNWYYPTDSGSPTNIVSGVVAMGPDQVLVLDGSNARSISTTTMIWSARAGMPTARSGFTLTTLASGQVIAAGGSDANIASAVVEAYDPVANSWAPAASLLTARSGHLATRLSDGRILVAGGYDATAAATRSVEVFDPVAGNWSNRATLLWDVGSLQSRMFALPNGRALIVHPQGVGLYDSSTNSWTDAVPPPAIASLPAGGVASAQLADGRIAVAAMGLYNPASNTWSAMPAPPRQFLAAAAIPGNRAVFIGGELVPCTALFCQSNFAYEYSPASNEWASVGDAYGAMAPDATIAEGGYFPMSNRSGETGYHLPGAFYRRSMTWALRVNNPFDLPLNPAAGQAYEVAVSYTFEADLLSRAATGALQVSDGSASCQIAVPATSCTLTTTVAGPKVLSISYPGDDNFASASITYQPKPHVIVNRSAVALVGSSPGGIYDIGFLHATAAPFAAGTQVTLTAVPIGGFTFTGWLGDCVGTSPCSFAMPSDRHVRVSAYAAANDQVPHNIDVDRSGAATAASDGLLILRYLLAQPEAAIVNGAMPPTGAVPGGWVTSYLMGIRPKLDVDGNGIADARTDGLLILRYLMGMRGNALIANCVGANAVRSTAVDIEAYLATLLP